MEGKYAQYKCVSCYNVNVQKKPSKMQKQKFLHKSAFLGMSSSFDCVKIKITTVVLTSVMLVIIWCDCF